MHGEEYGNRKFYSLQVNNDLGLNYAQRIDDYARAPPLVLIVRNGEVWFAHNEQVRCPLQYQNLNRVHFKGEYVTSDETTLEISRMTVYFATNGTMNGTFNGTMNATNNTLSVNTHMYRNVLSVIGSLFRLF